MIHYTLEKNYLTPDPNDFRAMTHPAGSIGDEDIIRRIVERGTTVAEADVAAVLRLLSDVVIDAVKQGYKVNMDLGSYDAGIKGVFTSEDEGFSLVAHRIVPRVSPSARMRRDVAAGATVQKEKRVLPMPIPYQLLDVASGEVNTILTPGSMAVLLGHRLKFNPDAPEEGIFLQAVDGSESRMAEVGINKPGRQVFNLPDDLQPGDYSLVVRASWRGSKDVREGILPETLSVTG
jgi:hypothetical protein